MMIVIYAEKMDVANKIAAALCGFLLPDGTKITFKNLSSNKEKVEKFQRSQGYLEITFQSKPCKVTWGYGHLYSLKDVFGYDPSLKIWSKRPICYVPKHFELQPIVSQNSGFNKVLERQRSIVAKLLNTADEIINATDDDREGELIFAYIREAIGCKVPFQRVRFTSQTEEGIKDAFAHLIPSSEVKNIELAGRARSIYDWLIGTNLTTRMTLKINDHSVWSVGRVQTLVLKMLADLEKQISSFISTPFWNLKATFTTAKGETYQATYKEEKMKDKAKAEAILHEIDGTKGIVTNVTSKSSKKEIPLLYSQTALQIDASKLFGYSAKQTLDIAQTLYEDGYTTYPRTKSQYLNDDMVKTVISVLNSLKGAAQFKPFLDGKKLDPNPKFFNSKKVDGHFAIIPTGIIPSSLPKEQENIFNLICYSIIRTIYSDATLSKTTVETAVDSYLFHSSGTAIIDPGWMAVAYKSKETLLPALSKGEVVSGKYEVKEGKTEPPKRYDDGSLVAAMRAAGKNLEDDELRKVLADPKVEGIGTDATRAEIIDTLIRRKYVERKGKSFYVTEKGMQLIDHFPAVDMLSAEFTAKMEQNLTAISKGELDYDTFITDIIKQTTEWCNAVERIARPASAPTRKITYCAPPLEASSSKATVKENVGPCPMCGREIKHGMYGYYCPNSSCKFKLPAVVLSHNITTSDVKSLLNKGKTRLIKDFVSKKTGNQFSAYLVLDPADGSIKFVYPS